MSPRLERGHAGALSFRTVAAVSRFRSGRLWDLWLSLEAFPRGFPTRLCHKAVPRATVVGVDPRHESRVSAGKKGSLQRTETSGGLWEWWHDPGVPLAFPMESASFCVATGTPGILSRPSSERILHFEVGGGNVAPLDVRKTLVLPLLWRRYVGELLELQQGCEGPFGGPRG